MRSGSPFFEKNELTTERCPPLLTEAVLLFIGTKTKLAAFAALSMNPSVSPVAFPMRRFSVNRDESMMTLRWATTAAADGWRMKNQGITALRLLIFPPTNTCGGKPKPPATPSARGSSLTPNSLPEVTPDGKQPAGSQL